MFAWELIFFNELFGGSAPEVWAGIWISQFLGLSNSLLLGLELASAMDCAVRQSIATISILTAYVHKILIIEVQAGIDTKNEQVTWSLITFKIFILYKVGFDKYTTFNRFFV